MRSERGVVEDRRAEGGVVTELWVECPRCGLRANALDVPPDCGCAARFWLVLPELTRRAPVPPSWQEPAADRAKFLILQGRLWLQRDLGREPGPAELADITGLSEAVIDRYWDETGAGAVPSWLLERWIAHIDGDSGFADPPALVVVRSLLRMAVEVSDGYLDLLAFLARANAAPEAEMARLTLLWTKWTAGLVAALSRHGVPQPAAETAVKRAIIVLWDAVTRWGAAGHEGHYGPFLREALLAQIPEAMLVVDDLTAALPEWQATPL